MILFPDQGIKQPENETVFYGTPIHQCDWEFLYSRGRHTVLEHTGMRYVVIMDETTDGNDPDRNAFDSVYYMRNDSELNDRVCVLLRTNEDRDTCLESAAWIRINEDYAGMIYIVRGVPDNTYGEKWEGYAAAIGTDQSCVCMVDFVTINDEDS